MVKITVAGLSIWYDEQTAIKNLSLQVSEKEILGIIGPSNSGKTSFLRTLNRLNELTSNCKTEGEIQLDGKSIFKEIDLLSLRKLVGIVFALPLPLPLSIYDNIAYGPRLRGEKNKSKLDGIVEKSLKASYLFDEVKDRLNTSAFNLSGGQQQRLCISRTLANEPEIILYDEPCSGLDPISTAKVEEAMRDLKKNYTQILVTNNTKQAARVADRTAFFLMGELVEIGDTTKMFTSPSDKRTDDYIAGRFG
ncbi:phosphate ABC transporter ATP-binding protein [candidate division WOR-1 bacterium RIFOXYA12_FULL_43_27]|uniref:Phosphate ABC transporter ATP-binding protein n=1 Tax=candidate division WOR-1 bacterium RIFOXYC2_FULL_46_14 TaxID=1802587 RepID=A0A1F4U6R6_UNCSA|nr:MAG: phosphate ABC transporter ATP-binding protein [candidate division WOR-1 bacterium RIFOXYA12_FULL_43_27]OGC20675.1 MAG: phosphate ABC transporter ATP-binding protein [candidate division WOR-1 bacterium RIFOXYB2_FULL_46_45]OGC31588.1 MAG: phosphate ABC transporter ATP-binding protein [candidate division WOR-1 bacterium RIFOXYA2_FULL_46_56]OGC39993.1 MAG: phosphate ABC transporter ATP-binding protein [candidate division WOR-1 bacterium RIFOXYC2_FULL_46_14]